MFSLVYVTSSRFLAKGPVIPASKSMVQGNRRPRLSYRAAHAPNASVPVSSKILTHGSGRDWNINSATWFPTQDTRVTRGTNQGPSGCPHIHGLKGEIVYGLLEHACSFLSLMHIHICSFLSLTHVCHQCELSGTPVSQDALG